MEKKDEAVSWLKQAQAQIECYRRKNPKKTLTIVIDGMSGAGKSTLGDFLQKQLDGYLFHMDDFFLQTYQRTEKRLAEPGGNVDYERFKKEIVDCLQDVKGLQYGIYDCHEQRIREQVRVSYKDVNIIEGCYSAHPYLGDYGDVYLFLEIAESTQGVRIRARNGEEMFQRFMREWIPKENQYFNFFDIRKKCVCIQTDMEKGRNTMVGLIVAYSKNRVIGKDGQIPWRIKGEQKRFRELTTGNVVIMGRRSYEEIGRPLPNRYTIVVSNTQKFEAENCTTVGSLQEALEIADNSKNIYISGGAGLYKEAIDIVDKMYITEIDAVVEGDTYFPEFKQEDFIREVECHVEGDLPYDYVTYTRR